MGAALYNGGYYRGTHLLLENIKAVEWAGSISAMLGSFVLATHCSWADYGFIAYLISNAFLIVFTFKKKLSGILSMQLGFTASSIIGIVNSQF